MKFNGEIYCLKIFRIFEVRGTHLDYKPPEIKTTNIHKMTKATISRIQMNDKSDTLKKKIKEIKKERCKFIVFYFFLAKSRSRSRSKSGKHK